jgi:hypothetical protein
MAAFPQAGLAVAAAGAVAVLSACGGSASAATSKACGVARTAARHASPRTMNGPVMGAYATALAGSGATGALALPVGNAVQDAQDAQADAKAANPAQYQADAELFMSDVTAIVRDCSTPTG